MNMQENQDTNVDADLLEKRRRFEEKHEKIMEKMKQAREEKKNVTNDEFSANEATKEFSQAFNDKAQSLSAKFEECVVLSESNKDEVPAFIKGIGDDILEINELFVECTIFLSKYDQKYYREQIDSFQKQLQTSSDTYMPRKKFKFGKKVNKDKKEKPKEVEDGTRQKISDEEKPSLFDKENEEFTYDQESLQKEQDQCFRAKNIKGCTLNLNGLLKAVFLQDVEDCTINIGPISGACFVRGCKNCIINVACHQLRIHDAFDTHFFVFVRSNPIIEHSNALKFSPYNYSYDDYESHMETATLAGFDNLWYNVQDFNWHKKEKSPHFEVIE